MVRSTVFHVCKHTVELLYYTCGRDGGCRAGATGGLRRETQGEPEAQGGGGVHNGGGVRECDGRGDCSGVVRKCI